VRGSLRGSIVGEDAKAGWAAAGHGRKPASGLGRERGFDLADDGEKGGRRGLKVIALGAHVEKECIKIIEGSRSRVRLLAAAWAANARGRRRVGIKGGKHAHRW